MKSLFFTLNLLILCVINSAAQQPIKDIKVTYELNKDDLQTIANFLDIDYTKFELSKKFTNRFCNVIVDEYKYGKLIKQISWRDSVKQYDMLLKVPELLEKEKFEVTFISQKINDSILKLKLGVGGIGFNSKLKLIDTLQYSWKSLSDFDKKKLVINIDSILPVLTFTSPVGQQFAGNSSNAEFCKINNNEVPHKDWYIKLGIVHYYIYSLKFEK